MSWTGHHCDTNPSMSERVQMAIKEFTYENEGQSSTVLKTTYRGTNIFLLTQFVENDMEEIIPIHVMTSYSSRTQEYVWKSVDPVGKELLFPANWVDEVAEKSSYAPEYLATWKAMIEEEAGKREFLRSAPEGTVIIVDGREYVRHNGTTASGKKKKLLWCDMTTKKSITSNKIRDFQLVTEK